MALYNVFNFQKMASGQNVPQKVGTWDSFNGVQLESAKVVQFGLEDDGSILSSFESRCQLCKSGEIQVSYQTSCCNLCVPCTDDTYTNSSTGTECLSCGTNMWGNNPVNGSDGCVPLQVVYLSYDSAWGIALIVLAVVGLISVIGVSVTIALFWANPVIKSFGREHLVLILIGLTLSFFSPLVYIFTPSVGLCLIRRLSFQFSWTIVLASILVKLIRVTRIFLGGIRSTRKYFLKPWHQVVFAFLIVGGKMVLGVIWIIVDLPDLVSTEMDNNTDDGFPILITTCASIHTAMLVLLLLYDTVLVILINGLGVFTIRSFSS